MITIAAVADDTDKPRVLFENVFNDDDATLSASGGTSSIATYTNALNGNTADFWDADTTGSATIEAVFTGNVVCDTVFIDAHNLGDTGAEFRVQYSTDGGSTWINAFTFTTFSDNSPIMVIFQEQTGDAWRVQKNLAETQIGVVMLGQSLIFPTGVDTNYTGFKHGHIVEILGGTTLGGQFVGQQYQRKGGTTSLQFPVLPYEFVDDDMADFERHYNEGQPFAFATRPAYDADEVAYCWRGEGDSELRPTYSNGGKFENFTMGVKYYVA